MTTTEEIVKDLKAIVAETETLRFQASNGEPAMPIHEQAVRAGIDPSLILFIIQTFGPAAIKILELLIERRKKRAA